MSAILLLSSSVAMASAASDKDLQDVLAKVDKTNAEINKSIDEAIQQANKMIAKSQYDVAVVQYGKELVDAQLELEKLNIKVLQLDTYSKEFAKASEDIAKAQEKINRLQNKSSEINKDLSVLKEALGSIEFVNGKASQVEKASKKLVMIEDKLLKTHNDTDAKVAAVLDKLGEDLDKLIQKLIDETNEMAGKTKKYGQDRGIEVICELVEVEIGDRKVWIDPMRVAW